jgi:hypothetical protein
MPGPSSLWYFLDAAVDDVSTADTCDEHDIRRIAEVPGSSLSRYFSTKKSLDRDER